MELLFRCTLIKSDGKVDMGKLSKEYDMLEQEHELSLIHISEPTRPY